VRCLSQVYTPVEVTVCPLRYPTKEEEVDPGVYAGNVQGEMAAALGLPAVDQDLYDAKALSKVGRCRLTQ